MIGENQTLSDWLGEHARERPEAPALIDEQGTLSYGALAQAVACLCSGFADLGIGKGDVVGVQLPNLRSYVIAFLAVTARGGVFQSLHMPYRSRELQGLLADSGAKAVVVTNAEKDSRARDVIGVRDQLPALKNVIVAGPEIEGCEALSDLIASPADPSDRIATSDADRFLLLYTSGTTAAPKRVPHIYRSFLNNALLAARELDVRPEDRVLSLAPMTHLYGLFTLHLALASGATSVLVPAFNPATFLDDLQDSDATHVFEAPAHLAPFEAAGKLSPAHFAQTRLLCLSGSAVPPALARAVDEHMPKGVVVQLWGMSELQAGTFGRPQDPAEKRFTTAGAAVPRTQLRIVDEQGQSLSAGVEGALEVKGPSVFAGYLNRADETAKAFDAEGWFETGDLARLDADGFLTITGRTKAIINRGGVKYNPVEVEDVMSGLPEILQCAFVPVPDPELGERGCLCVTLAPDAQLDLETVKQALSEAGMAKYKWPEQLAIFDDLPMTPTKKIMRGKVAGLLQNRKDT